MSNALWVAHAAAGAALGGTPSAAPTTQSAPRSIYDPLIPLMAVGMIALAVWLVRRLANHEKLMLTNSPGRPNTLTPAHILALMAPWLIAGSAVMKLRTPQWQLLGQAGVQVLLLGASLTVAAFTFRLGLRRGLGLRMDHWLFDTGRGVLGYLAIVPVCILLNMLFTWLLEGRHLVSEHALLRMLREVSAPWKAVALFSGVILAPVGEEVFFRGLLQSMLRHSTGRPWAAVLVTSAVFALVHYSILQSVPAIFVLSLALGYNYERCGRLYPPILMHMLFNGVFMALDLTTRG